MRRRYDPADAEALAPLLASLGRELEERGSQLEVLENRIRELHASPFFSGEIHELEAEVAVQRREIRHCHQELERMGCSIVGANPLTIRIPTGRGQAKRSVVWQHAGRVPSGSPQT